MPVVVPPRAFSVGLSFARENDEYVRDVATHLAATLGRDKVLFDEFLDARAAVPDLDLVLPQLYPDACDLIVVFLSREALTKPWCRFEWRQIRQLLGTPEAVRIMPLYFDSVTSQDLKGMGLVPGDGRLRIGTQSAAEISEKILRRLREGPLVGAPAADRRVVAGRDWRTLLEDHGCPLQIRTPPSAVGMTAALLRISDSDPTATIGGYLSGAHAAVLDRLEEEVDEILGGVIAHGRVEILPIRAAFEIAAALEASRDEAPDLYPGAAALKVAQVIDLRLGQTFIHQFRSDQPLAPGDPLPLVTFPDDHLPDDLQRETLAELGDEPRERGGTDRVRHLQLAPAEVAEVAVRLLWKAPWLDPVTASTRFAAIVTNRSVVAELAWDEYHRDGRSWFYRMRAQQPARQQARVVAGLHAARGAGGDVVAVLPELTLTPALLEALERDRAFRSVALVVAGSAHHDVTADPPGHNVANVYAHGTLIHAHHKFSDCYLTRADGSRCREHVIRSERPAIDVLLAPGCSAIVLISEDALDRRLVQLIDALSPTLLLVPALCDDLEDFTPIAERVALASQGFTVVSCVGGAVGAMFGHPSGAPLQAVPRSPPCTVLFSLDGEVQIVDLA